jgi:hypothetical protein
MVYNGKREQNIFDVNSRANVPRSGASGWASGGDGFRASARVAAGRHA